MGVHKYSCGHIIKCDYDNTCNGDLDWSCEKCEKR